MADPTEIVDRIAPIYAQEMGEDWDELSEERRLQWRILAYKTYEVHVKNKREGIVYAIDTIESVQIAPSTPKSWLRGVQEAKNALVWMLEGFDGEIETRVMVPESVPEDFSHVDPYIDVRGGDECPEIVPKGEQCGAMHVDNWSCTRAKHPDHWMHWDADPGDFYDQEDGELIIGLDGKVLATWFEDDTLTSLHPALGDLDAE